MGSVTPSQTQPASGDTITWTAVGGFGPGTLQYYRYGWDQSPRHAWTDTGAQWSSGTIATGPVSAGNWYLHVKGYNGADVGNGTYDYAITASQSLALRILAIHRAGDGAVNLTWSAISGMTYRVEDSPRFSTATWSGLPPDVMATGSTASKTDDPGSAVQRFYRVMLLPWPWPFSTTTNSDESRAGGHEWTRMERYSPRGWRKPWWNHQTATGVPRSPLPGVGRSCGRLP